MELSTEAERFKICHPPLPSLRRLAGDACRVYSGCPCEGPVLSEKPTARTSRLEADGARALLDQVGLAEQAARPAVVLAYGDQAP
jgi:hypothetical protein